jgi:hypothetical protein
MQVFTIAPAASRVPWLLLIPILGLVAAAIVLTVALFGFRNASFEVTNEGLRVRGDMYGRLIPRADLDGGAAQRIDFERTPQLKPARRGFGTGMPGYSAGWFRLASGEKALVYLTDRSRAVYVPTRAGYSVVVSPAEPDRFVAALREISASR